jgi:cobalamin biosynthesis Mg chelatase CobN
MMSIARVNNSKRKVKDVSLMSIDELLREAIDRMQRIEGIIRELKEGEK